MYKTFSEWCEERVDEQGDSLRNKMQYMFQQRFGPNWRQHMQQTMQDPRTQQMALKHGMSPEQFQGVQKYGQRFSGQ